MIKTKTYSCGLRLVFEKTKSREVTLGIGVACGSRNEKKDEYGLSHFLEHLFFKSTKTKTTKQLSQELEGFGTKINAWTSEDCTFYHFKSLVENFEKSLELYSDMFFNGVFNEEEVNKERNVILEEIKMYEDNSTSKLLDTCIPIIFKNTDYEHTVLGDESVIKNISIKRIKQYKEKHYKPENIIISIAGGINFKTADKLVTRLFCDNFKTESKPNILKCKNIKTNFTKSTLTLKKEDKQTKLLIIFNEENATSKLKPIISYYKSIMGGGMSSRMFTYLREERGLCYSTYSQSLRFFDAGRLLFFVACKPEKVADCVRGIRFLIDDAAKNGFTQEEFERARNSIKANILFSDNTSSKARFNFNKLLTENKTMNSKDRIKKIESVKLEDVNEFAKTVAKDKNFLIATIGNETKLKDLKLFEK